MCKMWETWRDRNNCIFNGVEVSAIELKVMYTHLIVGLIDPIYCLGCNFLRKTL